MAFAALLPSWLGLAGSFHWFPDLFSHFRWQYLLVALVLVALSLWQRQRLVLAGALLTVLLNAALLAQLAIKTRSAAGGTEPDFALRVLSLNVLTSNPHHDRVVDHVAASGADVVFLAEIDAGWAQSLAPLAALYPHQFVHPRPDNFGGALLSRVPLADAELLNLGAGRRPTLKARVRHQGRDLLIVGMHPVPPKGGEFAMHRDSQIDGLRDYVATQADPVLTVGDFNASPWSAPMRRLVQGALGFRGEDPPWTPTWSVFTPFAVPIDHALCTAPLWITKRQVGPDVGSDHRPILVEVRWLKPQPQPQPQPR